LGIVLYQLVVGDLDRPLAQGWEREIEDELLREDIAACVDGDVARRLPSATALAERLRTLEERRERRKKEAMAAVAAEDAKERKARRRMQALIGALLISVVVLGIILMLLRSANLEKEAASQARGRAQAAEQQVKAALVETQAAEQRAKSALADAKAA